MTRWTALVLAGSRPGADPFAKAHGVDLKALIPVGGVPMVQRPVTALLAAAFLGETFGWAEGLGLGLIVTGLWQVSR